MGAGAETRGFHTRVAYIDGARRLGPECAERLASSRCRAAENTRRVPLNSPNCSPEAARSWTAKSL
jgi:hypothetical protein